MATLAKLQLSLALNQLDADAVRPGDIAKQCPGRELPGLDRERGAFASDLLAERLEIPVIRKAKVIRAPLVVAQVCLEVLDAVCRNRVFTRPFAADDEGHAAKQQHLTRAFQQRRVGKFYAARCVSHPPIRGTGEVDLPLKYFDTATCASKPGEATLLGIGCGGSGAVRGAPSQRLYAEAAAGVDPRPRVRWLTNANFGQGAGLASLGPPWQHR